MCVSVTSILVLSGFDNWLTPQEDLLAHYGQISLFNVALNSLGSVNATPG